MSDDATLEARSLSDDAPAELAPGLLVVWSVDRETMSRIPLRTAVELGRGTHHGVVFDDPRLSRQHVRIAAKGDGFLVEDLGSRNGTFVDGVRITQPVVANPKVIRVGDTLIVPKRALGKNGDRAGEHVIGPTLALVWDRIRAAAQTSDTLHINGESGAGKELAARHFHACGPKAKGPFVAVNCAAIPEGVAESLLFGAKKGAYSGAHADSEGYLQAADGGTLFLDEVGDLDLNVQAKLLRAIETREVLPLGGQKPVRLDLRFVSATHKKLRELVSQKKFRDDLFFRIGRPEIELPALRERLEDVPSLVRQAAGGQAIDASFLEAAMLRHWPGNVRELIVETKDAARQAATAGARALDATHLSASAGLAFAAEAAERSPAQLPDRETIERALTECEGRVATAARKLGVHRTQLRRWLEANKVDPKSFGAGDDGE